MRRRALFLLGGMGGAALDQIHVRAGVLSYRTPAVIGQAWWVAPQFGAAAVAIAETVRPFARGVSDPRRGRIAVDLGWFVSSYVATGLVPRRRLTLLAILSLAFLARMKHRTDAKPVVAFALLLAVVGTSYEHYLSESDLFSYANADLGNVPWWLPALYAQGAPLAIDLIRSGQRDV